MLTRALIALLNLYKLTISPLLGPRCRFYPSCSQYAVQAIQAYGAAHGSYLAVKRLLRCHPWHVGGYDPVPETGNASTSSLCSTDCSNDCCTDPRKKP
jgi:putative membrane protein insertion efficiency factor